MPVDWLRGSLSPAQALKYNGADAYTIGDGERVTADDYQPKMVAKVLRLGSPSMVRYYQIRTRSSVNMTSDVRKNMATMGAAAALYAALVSDKQTDIYIACVDACPKGKTLRQFIMPILMDGLDAKVDTINIAANIDITNPWVHDGTQTLTIAPAIIDKFSNVLS